MTTTEPRVVDLDPGELGIVIVAADGGRDPVIVVTGEIDAATAPRLVAAFEFAAARRPAAITVDLSGVPFMDSSGVNALVDLCSLAVTWRGSVVVTGAVRSVRRVCDLTGVAETDGLVLR